MATSAPPPLAYRPADPPPPWGERFGRPVAATIAIVGLVALVVLAVQAGRPHAHETPLRIRCSNHLQQVGLAILLFQGDHADHYPASLADVLSTEQIDAGMMTCPETADTAAALPPEPTRRQAAAALAVPGHLSYVYCGHADWIAATVPADAIVMYEPLANHGGGANFLYGDGHADWEPQPRAGRLIAAARATTRPVAAATVR